MIDAEEDVLDADASVGQAARRRSSRRRAPTPARSAGSTRSSAPLRRTPLALVAVAPGDAHDHLERGPEPGDTRAAGRAGRARRSRRATTTARPAAAAVARGWPTGRQCAGSSGSGSVDRPARTIPTPAPGSFQMTSKTPAACSRRSSTAGSNEWANAARDGAASSKRDQQQMPDAAGTDAGAIGRFSTASRCVACARG